MASTWARDDVLQDFDELMTASALRALFEAHGIDKDAFLWAHKVLNSRMITFKRADGSNLLVIPPGIDLFNHEVKDEVDDDDVRLEHLPGAQLSTLADGVDDGSIPGAKLLVVRATRDYARGEQAFFSYSGTSNGRLLMSGGFVLAENMWDSVELALTIPLHPASTSLYADLSENLDRGATRGGAFAEAMPAEFLQLAEPAEEGMAPSEMVLHVRLAAATLDVQLSRIVPFFVAEQLGRGSEHTQLSSSSLEDEGQRQIAKERLRRCITALAGGYRDSLESDEHALEGLLALGASLPLPSRRKRDALRVKIGERKILERAIQALM